MRPCGSCASSTAAFCRSKDRPAPARLSPRARMIWHSCKTGRRSASLRTVTKSFAICSMKSSRSQTKVKVDASMHSEGHGRRRRRSHASQFTTDNEASLGAHSDAAMPGRRRDGMVVVSGGCVRMPSMFCSLTRPHRCRWPMCSRFRKRAEDARAAWRSATARAADAREPILRVRMSPRWIISSVANRRLAQRGPVPRRDVATTSDICAFTSELFYEGRLHSRAGLGAADVHV